MVHLLTSKLRTEQTSQRMVSVSPMSPGATEVRLPESQLPGPHLAY